MRDSCLVTGFVLVCDEPACGGVGDGEAEVEVGEACRLVLEIQIQVPTRYRLYWISRAWFMGSGRTGIPREN